MHVYIDVLAQSCRTDLSQYSQVHCSHAERLRKAAICPLYEIYVCFVRSHWRDVSSYADDTQMCNHKQYAHGNILFGNG